MGVKSTSLPGGDLTSKQADAPNAESSSGSKTIRTAGMSAKPTYVVTSNTFSYFPFFPVVTHFIFLNSVALFIHMFRFTLLEMMNVNLN